MATVIERMVRWSTSLGLSDIPEPVVEEAKLQLISMIAAVHSGSSCETGRASIRAARTLQTRGNATILATGEKVASHAAVLANASLSMIHDFDDYLFLGHTGHSAVLASIAEAEEAGASVEDLLVAQIAANEVAGRLGGYVILGPHNGQMWVHIHLAAAVIGASRLRGLDAQQAAHAMAIAFAMPPYPLKPAFFGTAAKALTAATPACTGLTAVRLAAEGMTGAVDIIEHERGFGARFSFIPLHQVLAGLGESWVTQAISCKIHPGCAYVGGAVAAALEATGNRPLDAADIEQVDIQATALTTAMERMCESSASDPLDPVAVSFSARRSVAIALLEGGLQPSQLSSDWLEDHRYQVQSLVARTTLGESRPMTLEMLKGMGLGVDIPALVQSVGLARLWKIRGRFRLAYSDAFNAPLAQKKRSWRDLNPWAQAQQGDTFAVLGDLITRAGAPFDMATSDFSGLQFKFGADVEVTLADGSILRGSVRIPPGVAGRPHEQRKRDVIGKLRSQAPDLTDAVLDTLERDPSSTAVSDLVDAASAT